MAVEDLFLAVSGRFSGFKPIFQRLFRQKCGISPKSAISKKSFAFRNFFEQSLVLHRAVKRKFGEIWAFSRKNYEKGKSQLEKGKKEIWAF